MNKYLGLGAGVLGLALLLLPANSSKPKPVKNDDVSKAFDTYQSLWLKHQANTLAKVESGELDTEAKVWEYIAAGQTTARNIAFDEIAKKEKEFFKDGWTKEKQIELLRSYVK